MKHMLLSFALLVTPLTAAPATDSAKPNRSANTVSLDAMAIQNLQIETTEAEETTFSETIFALGRIQVLPGKKGVVSSRVAGRAMEIKALPDLRYEAGAELVIVESRQVGDPPPMIRLAAPVGGIVSKINVAVGQPVEPGDTLIEILDLATVEASAAIPEHLAGRLTKDLTAEVRLPGFPNQVFKASLSHLGAEANAAAGTIEAAFHIENPAGILRPGMRAEFSILLSQRENVMSVPLAALLGDASHRFVYIKDYELAHAFVKTPVVIGAQNDQRVEIKQGLLPGDEVVIRGGYSLAHAGKGSVSLKEALDAAHGHPHNEDGSEMTAEQMQANQGSPHSHDEAIPLVWPWQLACGLLAGSLILALIIRRQISAA
jgi:membrane fusion protein, heavy metal efflux system